MTDIETKWQCSECDEIFASEELVPTCPHCEATGDNIIGLELEE